MNAPAESRRSVRGTPPHEIEFAEGLDATEREGGWPRGIGLGALALLLAAGFSGLLGGGGPLGTVAAEAPPSTAGGAPPLRVTAERVARRDAPTALRIEAAPRPAAGERLRLRLDRRLLDHVRVVGMEPPPLATEILGDGTWTLVFAAPAGGGGGGGGALPVTLWVRHQDAFRLVPVRVALDGDGAAAGGATAAAAAFRQLVLP